MAGTTVNYNGVTIQNCQTLRFDQSIEWDESGSDILYSKFRIRVSGLAHSDQAYFISTQALQGSGTATAVMSAAQKRLMHPRGDFSYVLPGGDILLAASASAKSLFLDVNSGPKPQACDITHVAGNKVFRIEFEIEICRVLCSGNAIPSTVYGAKGNAAVLNNRWSIEETKDSDFFTTRTFEGTLRVSHISAWPHMMRYLCVPPLQRGYQRKSMRFVDTPDGLTLKYNIQDVQQYAAPPKPATNWKSNYTESTGNDGAVGHGDMYVMLKGAPETPKKDLLAAAAAVIFERLGDLQKTYSAPGAGKHSTVLTSASFTEHLESNTVELRVRVRHPVTAGFLATKADTMGKPLAIAGYDPKEWPVPKLFDSSSHYGVYAKYLQSPCIDIHGITQAQAGQPEDDDPGEDQNEPTQPEVFEAVSLTFDDGSGQSQTQKGNFPYTFMTLENDYEESAGMAHLPIASSSAGSASSVAIPLHQGICQRTFVMHAERMGTWPEVPSPNRTFTDSAGIVNSLLGRKIIPAAPVLQPDGKSRLFSVQVRHVYAMSRCPTDTELLDVPSDPRDQSTPGENVFDGSLHYSTGNIA